MKTKNAPMVVRVGLVILAGAMTPLCRLGHGGAIAHDWPDDFRMVWNVCSANGFVTCGVRSVR